MPAIYFDHHSTTPLDSAVLEAMMPYLSNRFGNAASRQHVFGWEAEEAVSVARIQVAGLIGAESKEIVFTGGATEANNLAIKGIAEAYRSKGNHIITCVTEHKCVIESLRHLEKSGAEVTWIGVDREGFVDPAAVKKALTPRTILISVMLANNEVGTLQPLAEISEIARKANVLLHSDLAQAVGNVPVDVDVLGVDLASLSAHKFYGPKGVGALYVRGRNPRVKVVAQMDGGGHEGGLRSGTLNVPAIVGMGKAAQLVADGLVQYAGTTRRLRDRLWQGIGRVAALNGPADMGRRLPNNLNIRVDGLSADSIMMAMKDFAVSSGSACSSAVPEPSHVLRALGLCDEESRSSIRIGLGRTNTEAEVDRFVERFIDVAEKLKSDRLAHI